MSVVGSILVRLNARRVASLLVAGLLSLWPSRVGAQAPAPEAAPPVEHQHETPADAHAGHNMAQMDVLFPGRTGSGTSWLPSRTTMIGAHLQAGPWTVMLMGNGFLQYLNEVAPIHRGADQAGSINWLMLMARRPAGAGWAGLRAMASAEPFTIGGCGYPNLLATGERCEGDTIHDRQHQHDLFMELAAEYDRPIGKGLRWHVYGGPVGEPALGPVAFPHRQSALLNPLAPIAHHWLDATHITFGVVTSGISTTRWRAEGSAFNGREPDERRTDFDLGALDSFSARFAFQAADGLAVQVSAGRLESAEPSESGRPPVDVARITASMLYQGTLAARPLSVAVAWGSNHERDTRTHAALAEATLAVTPRDSLFGRAEIAGKTAHDLHAHHEPDATVLTVGKFQAGYVRLFAPRRRLQAGLGGSLSAAFVPATIQPNYGGVGVGFGVFALVRPVTP
jgi:hypothetical protein